MDQARQRPAVRTRREDAGNARSQKHGRCFHLGSCWDCLRSRPHFHRDHVQTSPDPSAATHGIGKTRHGQVAQHGRGLFTISFLLRTTSVRNHVLLLLLLLPSLLATKNISAKSFNIFYPSIYYEYQSTVRTDRPFEVIQKKLSLLHLEVVQRAK